MSLHSLLNFAETHEISKQGISEERLRECLPALREKIAFYREYPDLFVDDIKGPDSKFKFRFSQRVFLRCVMRHKYVYSTFPRGFSKSFLTMLALVLRAVLFPGSQLFVTSGGKEQAASITIAKIDEICKLLPALGNEINWDRGESKKSKDDVIYKFKNGSSIDILAAKESSRGQRRTGGVVEEAILINGTALNEIIIPTTNIDRMLPDGTYDHNEVVNQSMIYITTAGWKNSFPYEKLMEILISSIIFPDTYMILGGDYELAILEGAVKETMIEDMKLNGSYDEGSFEREYGSVWSGDAKNAFFSSEGFDKCRTINRPDYEYSSRVRTAYYIIGVDVGRFKCTTEACIFKVMPQHEGTSLKSLVNIYTYEAEDFETQAIKLKKLYYQYKARCMAIDGNGVGAGLIDFMTKTQIDPETGDTLPPFGVNGGTSEDSVAPYKKIRGSDVENDAMFIIKAHAQQNTEAYTYMRTQMGSGKVKLLVDEREASAKLMETKVGQKMSPDERAEYLYPYVQTSILKEQTLNLIEENEGININLKPSNASIKKDKFSAFLYGLYYIKFEEENKNRRRKRDMRDFMMFS